MRVSIFLFLTIFSLFAFIQNNSITKNENHLSNEEDSNRIIDKGKEAFEFCKKNKYNTDFCILIDMKIHSGKNRLFLWNFQNDSIINSGLCSHGCCDNLWGGDYSKLSPEFSNITDSHCSSLGKFKIGDRGNSQWGININYKLHGLDNSNKNAYSRYIVLHSWEMVSDTSPFPDGTPEGWGCPAVSNTMMKYLDAKLKNTSRPVLLWIFN